MSKRTNSKILTKKAQAYQSLILWVLAIATIVVLVAVVPSLFNINQEERQDILCKFTVSLQDKFRTLQLTPIGEKCARKFITFHDDHAEVQTLENSETIEFTIQRGDGTTYQSETYPQLTETIFNSVIADEMLNCWEKFGSGEKSVFQGDLGHDNTRICAICAEISFMASRDPINEPGNLYTFLQNKGYVDDLTIYQELTHPSDQNWVEFLTTKQLEWLLSNILDEDEYEDGQIPSLQVFDKLLDKDENYLIVFSQFKPGLLQDITLDDQLSFIIFGTADDIGLGFDSSSERPSYCEIIAHE